MPGRQAHGRPLLPTAAAAGAGGGSGNKKPSKSHTKHFKKSRAKATANALDAFARAAEQVGADSPARGVRRRALDDDDDEQQQHPGKRQRRGEDDVEDFDDGDEDLDGGERRKKRARREQDGEDGFDGFSDDDGGGSDSEEWHVGVGGEDEDSELDSDEAFGESDEERFEGFGFAGSSSKGGRKRGKRKGGDEEEEEEQGEGEDDLESLGSDAIDLATALDQLSEDDEGEEQEGSGSEEEDEESSDADDESEEDEDESSKLDALQSMIAGFAGGDDEEGEQQTGSQSKPKLSLKDLGLAGVKDPHIKRALRLMNKEEKAVKPGSSKKLDVPLAKRQQDRLLRSAAYEKTNETLGRWVETVKHNRRADHLVFPLAQNAHDRGLDGAELMPINQKTSGTELEQTILAIMEESGLGPSAKAEKKEEGDGTGKGGLSQAELKEIQRQRRRERELHSREMARAKRIKKIKSKAYRRIHRKELLREQEAEHEAALANGELDSEDEREALDRRRALERVGTRHRESKWAKLGKKAGRAVWDENFRAGLTEMAQRKEELRRRIEGRTGGSDDDDDDDGSDVLDASGEGDNRHRLLAELERAAAYEEDEAPQSKLMQMKFMQRGEELRKKENDEAIAELRRQLDSDNEAASDEEMEIGRRQYGMGNSAAAASASTAAVKKAKAADSRRSANSSTAIGRPEPTSQTQTTTQVELQSSASAAAGAWAAGPAPPPVPAAAGVWSQVEPSGRKSRKASKATAEEVDISNAVTLSSKPSKPKHTSHDAATVSAEGNEAHDSDDEADLHLPMAIRDQKLIERAFAGEDVHGQFEEEKAEIEREDDEKEIDNTLPGWGSWVGEGVSNREKRRHQGRFITKVEGVKKRDRKDFRLKDVIISEKRIKKNDKYLATGLPHPFESQQQYERSLRLPVGPEWVTKETFQDATKPRVIVKQGIIAPMSKPMY
ncbi:Utp14 protein-domain-containing protein [Achaetomium macrosporum]|uniref:Utp14 protein-domain-containing protein n=1 Tax=Achaetomium macrosporum TaxID=79813 RepID=A0AAN7C3T7_9PEZI|nr:Utp14 protein-domain-containing protein [Achaetomium macrosporum]